MSYPIASPRSASPTHCGMGTAPVSQRVTVTRWTPRDAARPDCVSPASVRSVRRVSGLNEALKPVEVSPGAVNLRSIWGVLDLDFRASFKPTPGKFSAGYAVKHGNGRVAEEFGGDHLSCAHRDSQPVVLTLASAGASVGLGESAGIITGLAAVGDRDAIADVPPAHPASGATELGRSLRAPGYVRGTGDSGRAPFAVCGAVHPVNLCLHAPNVARRYTRCNNLYQSKGES